MNQILVRTAALVLLLAPRFASAADDPIVRAAASGDMKAVRTLLVQKHDPDADRKSVV